MEGGLGTDSVSAVGLVKAPNKAWGSEDPSRRYRLNRIWWPSVLVRVYAGSAHASFIPAPASLAGGRVAAPGPFFF